MPTKSRVVHRVNSEAFHYLASPETMQAPLLNQKNEFGQVYMAINLHQKQTKGDRQGPQTHLIKRLCHGKKKHCINI